MNIDAKICIPFDPAILLEGVYPKEALLELYKDLDTRIFITVLLFLLFV